MNVKSHISGVILEQDLIKGIYICYIDNFSDELEDKIRSMLSSIWSGAADLEENKDLYGYKNTLKRFLERYLYNKDGNEKSQNIKKGIIGELLSHLLIPEFIPGLKVVSVMQNLIEKSVRKGFDIVYYDSKKQIWYCEVKSGGDLNNTEDINNKNKQLLNKAKEDIHVRCFSNDDSPWISVLAEVNKTISDPTVRIDVKKLLKEHHPDAPNRGMERNVILSSVLYKNIENKISPDILNEHKTIIDNEKIFVASIIFSIQKPTYKKIEDFLIREANIV